MPYPMTGYNANPWNYTYPTYSPSVTNFPGQMSQEQLNYLMNMANQFKGMLPK